MQQPPNSDHNDSGNLLFAFFTEIGIISQLSGSMFEKALPDGMTQAQFSVLNWFVRVDSVATPGRLAAAFQVTPGAMTNTLKRLETKGLIRVQPDPDSGRKKQVTITEQGKQARNEALKLTFPLFEELASKLDLKSLPQQINELRKIREFLDQRRFEKK